jgi:hypothetical protein
MLFLGHQVPTVANRAQGPAAENDPRVTSGPEDRHPWSKDGHTGSSEHRCQLDRGDTRSPALAVAGDRAAELAAEQGGTACRAGQQRDGRLAGRDG